MTPTVITTLAEYSQSLAAEWSPRNALSAAEVPAFSGKSGWWKCSFCGDEFNRAVRNRTQWARQSRGCTKCSKAMRRVPKPGRSVAEARPDLVLEWSPANAASPDRVSIRGRTRVQWICSTCGHHWTARVDSRATNGCPACGRRSHAAAMQSLQHPDAGESLKDQRPDLAAEWNETEFGPESVKPSNERSVRWRCSVCSHQWTDSVKHRACSLRAGSCPRCEQGPDLVRRIGAVAHDLSLPVIAPQVMPFWHKDLNGELEPSDLHPSTSRQVWWLCKLPEHPGYRASVVSRVHSPDPGACPLCATPIDQTPVATRNRKSAHILSFGAQHPDILEEWHPTLNSRSPFSLTAASHSKFVWQCIRNPDHIWTAVMKNRTLNRTGCPFCRYHPTSAVEAAIIKGLADRWDIKSRHKIPHPDVFGGLKPDGVISELGIAVEFDGWRWHMDTLERDLLRCRQYEDVGWRVLRLRECPAGRDPLPSVGEFGVDVPHGIVVNCGEIVRIASERIAVIIKDFTVPASSRVPAVRIGATGGSS